MLLERRVFLICFVSTCIAFVPVLFWAGIYDCIVPVSALVLSMGFKKISIWMVIHIIFYTVAFFGIGNASYALIRRLPWNLAREFSLVALLILPFVSSFARVLTYSSLAGRGGTYTFWEATERYFEKKRL